MNVKELSVAEKRGIEPLIRSRYNNLISQLRDTEKHDITDLVSKIAKKFKVGQALAKMSLLQKQIEVIKKTIVDLGF